MISPKAILFDFGDTLCTLEKFDALAGNRRCLELARDSRGLSAEDIEETAKKINNVVMPLRESTSLEYRADTFQNLLFDYLGLNFPISRTKLEEEFWISAALYVPDEGVLATLTRLKNKGIRLGVVSNFSFSGRILLEELAKHNLLSFFKPVIASSDYGIRKPNALIFQLAAKMLELPCSEIWFVGDKLKYDVAGANAVGMTTVWYNRNGEDAGPIVSDYTITQWSDFPCLH